MDELERHLFARHKTGCGSRLPRLIDRAHPAGAELGDQPKGPTWVAIKDSGQPRSVCCADAVPLWAPGHPRLPGCPGRAARARSWSRD